jgi:molybdate transport system ATP-binding protein
MEKGEHIALLGPNGGGKSLLVDILIGRWPLLMNEVKYDFTPSVSALVCDNVKYITFRDSYGDADGNFYYQQRWNSQDMETTPLVSELLPQVPDSEWKNNLYGLFGVEEMLDKHLVLLSSGELRRFQLVKALLSQPRVLILDNPFIGLDASTRTLLRELLERMIRAISLQVILVLSRVDEIPSFITHVVPVEGLVCGEKMERNAFLCEAKNAEDMKMDVTENLHHLDSMNDCCQEEVIRLNKVTIRYGERTILKDLDWVVHRGEKWALTGDNGSGKSTLLSLVCADNPQSYACDIAMFGRKRGTGESIWEIKKRIGYVSPEIHRAYLKNIPAIDIVASGLHDSVGLYVRPKPEQRSVCEEWLDVFGIKELKDRSFLQLSSGEQRLVLLARAFVKDPDLLILDEPLHGLDTSNRSLVMDVIRLFANREGKTLIMVSHYQEEFPECMTHSLHLKRN